MNDDITITATTDIPISFADDLGAVTTAPETTTTSETSSTLSSSEYDVFANIERNTFQSASALTFLAVCLVIVILWGILKVVYNFLKGLLF